MASTHENRPQSNDQLIINLQKGPWETEWEPVHKDLKLQLI